MADTLILRTARDRYRDFAHTLASDVKNARLDRGVSQRALATAAGVDPSVLCLIETGKRAPSLRVLVALATALGMDTSLRLYPTTGPRIYDHTQSPILNALIGIAHEDWRRRLEVGVNRPARGVIDTVFHDPWCRDVVATEVQGQLRRVEQQLRWAGLKADSLPSASGWPWVVGATPRIHRLLVLRSTGATREIVRSLPEVFRAAYPVPEREAYEALTHAAKPWPGNGMLWADLDGKTARILEGPPGAWVAEVAPLRVADPSPQVRSQ